MQIRHTRYCKMSMQKYPPKGRRFKRFSSRLSDHTKPSIAPSMATANVLQADDRLDVVL